MKAEIHLGNITVPLLDYAVGAAAVLGIRDSGKTVTCKGIAEQLMDQKIPVIVFDAVGKWRFLKTASDVPGRGKAYKIVVVGGREPDLPLTKESIVEVVRAALKERISIVVDLFDPKLSKNDWKAIVKAAIRTIHYENDGSPIHVFLEEAAEFVPQKIIDFDVYAEIEKLARMGGNNGVGLTLINQRSQEVNKSVLEQCTTLILGQQIGSKAIEAVSKWVERLDKKTSEEVTTHLPKLRAGEAYTWTRQNPDHPTCQKFPMCRSYHPDRRTQTVAIKDTGHAIADTGEFVARMAAAIPQVIEHAKLNDPKELRAKLAQLERDLRQQTGRIQTVQVPVFSEEDRKLLESISTRSSEILSHIGTIQMLKAIADRWLQTLQRLGHPNIAKPQNYFLNEQHTTHLKRSEAKAERKAASVKQVTAHVEHNGKPLGKCEAAILNNVNAYNGSLKKSVAIRIGYAVGGGGFNKALSNLRTAQLIEGTERLELTAEGQGRVGPKACPVSGEEVYKIWMNHRNLGHAEREILRVLWQNTMTGPEHIMDKESLAERTISNKGEPYEANGGGFNKGLSNLRTLELIEGSSTIKLSEEFRQ